jgi:hypothetical protein
MTQYARPNADGGDAEWVRQDGSPSILWQLIDETSADDSDYMKSTHQGWGDTQGWCMIKLQTPDNPDPELDDHKIKYRAVGTGMEPNLTVALYLGTPETLIVSYTQTLNSEDMAGTWADYTISLDSTQAGNIGDNYDDLELWFKRVAGMMDMGGETVKVSQAWFECADVPEEEAATGNPAFLLFLE